MPYCPKCRAEVSSEMKFCPKCGASLGVTVQPFRDRMRERGSDILGAVSAGVILILIALTYMRYPIDPSTIVDYFESMTVQRTFIKPPLIFFDAAIFFFYAVGTWGIVLSGLRLVFQRSVRRALGDLVGGFFSFFFALLLSRYAGGVFTWRTTLAYFIVAIGLLVIVNAIIHIAFPER